MEDELGLRVDQYDLRAQEFAHEQARLAQQQAHEKELAKIKLRGKRQETWKVIAGCLSAVVVLVALALVFFTDFGEDPEQTPKKSDTQVEQEREVACVASGGGFIPRDTFAGSYPDHGLCVFPGRTVNVPEESQ